MELGHSDPAIRPDGIAASPLGDHHATSAKFHCLDNVEELCTTITRPISSIGVLGMLIAAAATVVDVLLRWLANSGLIALNEIIALAFAIAVTACIPAGVSRRVNLEVDVFAKSFSRRTEAWVRAFGAILLLLFFAVLTWQLLGFAGSLIEMGRRTVMLEILQWPFVLGAALLLLVATVVQAVVAANAVRRAAHARGAAEDDGRIPKVFDVALVLVGLVTLLVTALVVFRFQAVSYWVQDHAALALTLLFAFAWILLLAMVPLAAVLGLVGIVGSAFFLGMSPSLSALATEAVGFLSNYQVASLPLFLMMGSFAAVAGVAEDIYRIAHVVFGSFRGGLAMATIGGCAGFGTVSGSSLATVATFGRVAIPEMEARGYAPQLSLGCVAAGGTLGALIPPSGVLIIFALLTEASIGQLFVAAILPGVLAVALYLLAVVLTVRLDTTLVPADRQHERERALKALSRSSSALMLFGAVIGGLYTGIFTATEAAAVGAVGAFLIALFRGRLRSGNFWHVMAETTTSTALIYGIIFGVLIFSIFVSASELTERFTALISTLDLAPVLIILLILCVYVGLGCLMDSWTIMFITVPVVTPVVLHLGYDILWWGIINLVVIEIGQITPPFGINLFVLKGMTPEVPLRTVYSGVLPFCMADLVKLGILVAFPVISLWLPSMMFS